MTGASWEYDGWGSYGCGQVGSAYLATHGWEEGVVDVEGLWREDEGPEDEDGVGGPAGYLHQEQQATHLVGEDRNIMCREGCIRGRIPL